MVFGTDVILPGFNFSLLFFFISDIGDQTSGKINGHSERRQVFCFRGSRGQSEMKVNCCEAGAKR